MQIKQLVVAGQDPHISLSEGNVRLTLTQTDAQLLLQALIQAEESPGTAIPTHMASSSKFSCMVVKKPERNELHFLLQSNSHVTTTFSSFKTMIDGLKAALGTELVH